MKELLKKLCQPDNELRAHALQAELSARNAAYECPENMAVVVPAAADEAVVLCAHYDVFPGSFGYNDNGMSLAIILSLLERLPGFVEVVFTNGEERGFLGARHYLRHNRKKLLGCVNLDVCGFGDTVYCDPMNSGLEPAGSKIGPMPINDGCIFADHGIPALTFSAGPGEVSFDEGIRRIGRTIHNGPLDNRLDVLNFGLAGLFGPVVLRTVGALSGTACPPRSE